MMICHRYVSSQFGISVVVPIVKNKNGNISLLANYRPISMFNPYVDDMLNEIENSQLGCQFLMNIGCIMYADCILLLSASEDGLQHLLDVGLCGDYAQKHQLVFNCDKSVCMKVGCNYKYNITNVVLKNNTVNCVDSVRYLGIAFRRAQVYVFINDYADVKRKFYVASNSMLGCCKYADDCVKLFPMRSICFPMLTYCLDALDIPG